MAFLPGAWKVTEDNRLVRVSREESIDQPDWANHASLDGVEMVLRINTREQAEQRLPVLAAWGVSEADLSFYRKLHGLEAP